MTDNSFSKPEHPLFKEDNVRGFAPKSEKFLPEWFGQKFSISLMKLLELKGLHLALESHEHQVKHRPELESKFTDIMCFEIIHEEQKMGYLYLDINMIALLLHKVLGGSDRVEPSRPSLPLRKLEAKGLESAFGVFNLSLREGLKRSFPLREIDFIKLKGPIDEFQFINHLEGSSQYFLEDFIMKEKSNGIEGKIAVLLNYKIFDSFGK